ncbi:hypothetical protein D3C71_1625250 [compost metagenome]
MQRFQPVFTGNVREPVAIFFGRRLTDALDVLEHGKAQRVRVNPVVIRTIVRRLVHHVGVAVQKLQHKAFGHPAFIVKMVEDGVVPECRPAFVHHLRLFLRIKILTHLTHNT